MRRKYLIFLFTLIVAALSFVVLVKNWNSVQKWRHNSALVGFIMLFIICGISAYFAFLKKEDFK